MGMAGGAVAWYTKSWLALDVAAELVGLAFGVMFVAFAAGCVGALNGSDATTGAAATNLLGADSATRALVASKGLA